MDNLTLSYFVPSTLKGKYRALEIEKIAVSFGYKVKIFYAESSSQLDFLLACHRDSAVIVDCTIPNDLADSTVYPLLTAQINMLDHVLVISDSVLPLNITPQRNRVEAGEVLDWVAIQLKDLSEHKYYPRIPLEKIEDIDVYRLQIEEMWNSSIELHNNVDSSKKRVMISYRNTHSAEVDSFCRLEEAKGEVEIKVLPPGSLCGDCEALSPMRRWMLVGLLEDYIRSVDEIWVYRTDNYLDSWWTIAELIMVVNGNYSSENKKPVRVYDASLGRFLDIVPPEFSVEMSLEQHKRMARYLSNTRPNTMGPECLEQIEQLRKIAKLLKFSTKKMREGMIDQLRPVLEQSVPLTIPEEEHQQMIADTLRMYSDPKEMEEYVNNEVFKGEFWNRISYQVTKRTGAIMNGKIDVDAFMQVPMKEITKYSEDDFDKAARKGGTLVIQNGPTCKKYAVYRGSQRYLWLATRMGKPTVKSAPGLEVIHVFNLKEA
jgi:hypothetical protein